MPAPAEVQVPTLKDKQNLILKYLQVFRRFFSYLQYLLAAQCKFFSRHCYLTPLSAMFGAVVGRYCTII